MNTSTEFWPNGARLAVTVSMQFEAGGQPISGAPGPVAEPIEPGYPDLPQNSFYEYGIREGIPRMLNLFDKHDLKVTSFMIGEAVASWPTRSCAPGTRQPPTGAAGNQYLLEPEEERAWIADGVSSIERATGTRPRRIQQLLDPRQRAQA
jgi:Polysaccharide deacetylase